MTLEFCAALHQMNEPKLEPCSSCKKYPEVKQTSWGTQWRVVCPNNCIKPELRYTREAAIRLWNRVVEDSGEMRKKHSSRERERSPRPA